MIIRQLNKKLQQFAGVIKQQRSYWTCPCCFIDDFSRYGLIYLISHKSEVLDYFRQSMSLINNHLDNSIKALRTDYGRKYLSKRFKKFCDERRIKKQLTMPYIPQQNGVAKRRNRTLYEMIRLMMAQTNIQLSYQDDALLTTAYILNQVPSKSMQSTPYEQTSEKPNINNLWQWGSTGFVHNSFHKYGKFGLRENKCIFVRYPNHFKGYVLIGEQPDGIVSEIDS